MGLQKKKNISFFDLAIVNHSLPPAQSFLSLSVLGRGLAYISHPGASSTNASKLGFSTYPRLYMLYNMNAKYFVLRSNTVSRAYSNFKLKDPRVENSSPAMGRGIDSRNRIRNRVAKLHRLAGRYDNPMPTWFLAPWPDFCYRHMHRFHGINSLKPVASPCSHGARNTPAELFYALNDIYIRVFRGHCSFVLNLYYERG
jgi:hypothetical protein